MEIGKDDKYLSVDCKFDMWLIIPWLEVPPPGGGVITRLDELVGIERDCYTHIHVCVCVGTQIWFKRKVHQIESLIENFQKVDSVYIYWVILVILVVLLKRIAYY